MNSAELWIIENDIAAEGYAYVCGVDEAGRGPLAGPVCAAAVILPLGWLPEGLNDSKKLSERKREALYDLIVENAISFGIAFAGVEEIESENILNATFLAMNRAIEQLDPQPSLAIIDGNQNSGIVCPNRTIVHGDALCASIAAASILAKVTRDRFMCDMAEKYPLYGFEKHKGYGTPQHRAAILQHGPCEIHRPSFLRKMLNGQ
ncbi:MAG: ribonuclease HII [Oscillospiraceae bacterium]|nr:ribonuclease HII [Oscillospiraceae bacterium]